MYIIIGAQMGAFLAIAPILVIVIIIQIDNVDLVIFIWVCVVLI